MPLPSNGSMDQCVSRLNRNQEHDGADLITQLRVEVDVQTERADELADECELLKIMNREGARAFAKLKAIEALCEGSRSTYLPAPAAAILRILNSEGKQG